MKFFMSLALMALSLSGYAYEIEPRYYSPEFRIVSVRPMCPRSVPGGATCMGIGSIVTVEARLDGCLDKLVYNDFEVRSGRGIAELHAVGVAKQDPRSLAARCVRMPTVRRTITVQATGSVRVINQRIEQ